MRRTFVFIGALLLVLTPVHAWSHSLGVSLIEDVGEYTIDIGYDPVVLSEDENALFDFLFLRASSSVEYDHVWVRIRDDSSTILATGVAHQTFGPTALVYRFPHHGQMTIEASFRTAEGETLASAQFPLTVVPSDSNTPLWWYAFCVLGLFSIGILAWYVYRNRRNAVRI